MAPPRAGYGRPDRDIAPEIAQLESWRARRTGEPWRAHELASVFLYLVASGGAEAAPDARRLFLDLVIACARDGASELEQDPATAALADRAWQAAPAAWRRWVARNRPVITAAARAQADAARRAATARHTPIGPAALRRLAREQRLAASLRRLKAARGYRNAETAT